MSAKYRELREWVLFRYSSPRGFEGEITSIALGDRDRKTGNGRIRPNPCVGQLSRYPMFWELVR